MVYNRMEETYSDKRAVNPLVESLLIRLQMGVVSISTIFENYATAFEALAGMRGKPNCLVSIAQIVR
jgi:hypothetical protein